MMGHKDCCTGGYKPLTPLENLKKVQIMLKQNNTGQGVGKPQKLRKKLYNEEKDMVRLDYLSSWAEFELS